jgi:hypothetical protein
MKEDEKNEIKTALKEVLGEIDFGGCNSERCKEKCGITTVQHATEHAEWRAFRVDFDQIKKTIRNTIITVIIGAILSCTALGVAYTITSVQKNDKRGAKTTTTIK